MNQDYFSRYRDIAIALAIMVSAFASAAWGLARIRDYERPLAVLLPEIPVGASAYGLISNGRCVGSLEFNLTEVDKTLELAMRGEIRVRTVKMTETAAYDSALYFNPLGQLQNANFALTNGGVAFQISVDGVNPLNVRVVLSGGDKPWRAGFSIPGPISLVKRGEHFSLEHHAFRSVQPSILETFGRQAAGNLRVTLEAGEKGNACGTATHGAIDGLAMLPRFLPSRDLTNEFLSSIDEMIGAVRQ